MAHRQGWLLAGASIVLGFPAGVFAQTAVVQSPAAGAPAAASAGIVVLDRQNLSADAQTVPAASPLQPLLDFRESDVKFNLQTLMQTLRDNRHEGWVLAAYPDPKTTRPLIGAGFSLDLPAREHVQRDPLNPTQFLEPSSAQLWEAAGLEPQRLQTMLEQYDRQLSAWQKKKFRRKIRTHELFPQIGEDDAMKLLRISTIQAVHNARAYCRYFDQLSGPQQMALTQLVFQMGVNLEEFTQFLAAINNGPSGFAISQAGITTVGAPEISRAAPVAPATSSPVNAAYASESFATAMKATPAEDPSATGYWKSVQETLIHSDWARRYSTRAVSVIAMFDPSYDFAPWQAEARVRTEVHPLHTRRRRAATVRTASAPHRKSAVRRTHKS